MVQQILSAHDEGKEDYGYTILSLLAIQSWLDQFTWSNKKIINKFRKISNETNNTII